MIEEQNSSFFGHQIGDMILLLNCNHWTTIPYFLVVPRLMPREREKERERKTC